MGGELVKFLSEGEIDEMKEERLENKMDVEGPKKVESKEEIKFPEADINELVELGYARGQVIEGIVRFLKSL